MVIFCARSPAEPQTTGPTPAASPAPAGPTTAAPAPSAKMMQVDRSVQSIHDVIFSAPITSAFRADPARTESAAAAVAEQNPAQAALRSYAPGATMPSR